MLNCYVVWDIWEMGYSASAAKIVWTTLFKNRKATRTDYWIPKYIGEFEIIFWSRIFYFVMLWRGTFCREHIETRKLFSKVIKVRMHLQWLVGSKAHLANKHGELCSRLRPYNVIKWQLRSLDRGKTSKRKVMARGSTCNFYTAPSWRKPSTYYKFCDEVSHLEKPF